MNIIVYNFVKIETIYNIEIEKNYANQLKINVIINNIIEQLNLTIDVIGTIYTYIII